MAIERESTVLVSQPIDAVWNMVTDTRKLHSLFVPGTYEPLDTASAKPGTTFKYQSVFGGQTYPRYIVDGTPPHRFSFGHSPNAWQIKFDLHKVGEKTEVKYSRRFKDLSFGERLFKRRKTLAGYQEMVEETTARLADACERLANDGEDGITPSPWPSA